MTNNPNHLDILIIEDNPADLFLIQAMLRAEGTGIRDIHTASRITEGIEILSQYKIDIVLLDLSLPDSFGIQSYLAIKQAIQNIPVIILTGLTESAVALEALNEGAQDYLVKGDFKTDLLVRSIQYSIERKNAEKKILLSEENYRQMFYKNPFPAWIYDIENLQLLEVNNAAIETYGYNKEEFLTLTVQDIRVDNVEEWRKLSPQAIQDKKRPWVWKHKKKNGEIMIVEVTYYEIDYYGKTAMQAQMNDITERTRLQEELFTQQRIKAQQITKAILGAQEEERKIIGAELHDNINQILASAKLFYNAALDNPDSIKEMISKGGEYISMAIEEIRKLSRALVTPPFIEEGLQRSIEGMADDIMVVKPIRIDTVIENFMESGIQKDVKVAVYRIIQEQLNNILKHADASLVTIRISTANDLLILSVEDNGKGFDMQAQRKGIGLTNIQSRAELFNGKVIVDSSPGKGCRLKAELHIGNELPVQKAA